MQIAVVAIDPATARRARRLARAACQGIALGYAAMIDGPDMDALDRYARTASDAVGRDLGGHAQAARALIAAGADARAVVRDTLAGIVEDVDAEIMRLCAGSGR